MPKFESPDPISITIDILGDTHITASDRTDTVITVGPMDPSKSSDVKAAEQTVVDYSDGRLFVKSPRSWAPFSGSQTVVVTLEVPTGSAVGRDLGVQHSAIVPDPISGEDTLTYWTEREPYVSIHPPAAGPDLRKLP